MSADDWGPELPIPIPNLGGILRLGPDLRPRLFWQGQCGSDARPGYWCLSRLEVNPSGDFRKRMARGEVGPETADGIAWAEAKLAEWDSSTGEDDPS